MRGMRDSHRCQKHSGSGQAHVRGVAPVTQPAGKNKRNWRDVCGRSVTHALVYVVSTGTVEEFCTLLSAESYCFMGMKPFPLC